MNVIKLATEGRAPSRAPRSADKVWAYICLYFGDSQRKKY
jgi:hypothetical protein